MAARSLLFVFRRSNSAIRKLWTRNMSQVVNVGPDYSNDLIFTSDHQQMRETIRKIVDNDINPHVDEWEADKRFPAHEVFKILGNAGLLEYGGLGLDFTYSLMLAEETGRIHCLALPLAIAVQSDVATNVVASFASEKLKREFLAPAIAGDMVTCVGVSEVGAGSDVARIRTTAVKKGDDLIINGGKMWITNSAQADWMCLLANTSHGALHRNKSLIILPMKLPGITVIENIDTLGVYASDTAQIFFEDVRVPQSHIIGDEGLGFTYQMQQFQEERLVLPTTTIPAMEKAIRDTAEYAAQRKIFGRPLLDNQVVHFRLAELATEVELLRSLLYRTVGLYVQGNDVTKLASMAKLKAGRLCREVADSCLQYWGGTGFTNDVYISRFYRDYRLISIAGGADEVMLSIICKYTNTLPKQNLETK